jgi:hypothetical protein
MTSSLSIAEITMQSETVCEVPSSTVQSSAVSSGLLADTDPAHADPLHRAIDRILDRSFHQRQVPVLSTGLPKDMKADFAKADGFAVDDKSVTRVEAETAASNIPDGVAWQRSMGHDVKGFEWGGFSATQKVIFMFQAGAVIGMWLCANIELVAH